MRQVSFPDLELRLPVCFLPLQAGCGQRERCRRPSDLPDCYRGVGGAEGEAAGAGFISGERTVGAPRPVKRNLALQLPHWICVPMSFSPAQSELPHFGHEMAIIALPFRHRSSRTTPER